MVGDQWILGADRQLRRDHERAGGHEVRVRGSRQGRQHGRNIPRLAVQRRRRGDAVRSKLFLRRARRSELLPPRTISGRGSIAHAPWNADENPLGSLDLSFDDLGYYSAIFWDPLYRYPLTSTPQCGAGGLDDIMKSLAVQVEEFAPQATLQQGQSTDYGQGAEPQPSDTFATFTTSSSFKADVPGG